jgi:hypothetical protein
MALRGSIAVEGAGDSISTVELLEAMLTAGMTQSLDVTNGLELKSLSAMLLHLQDIVQPGCDA